MKFNPGSVKVEISMTYTEAILTVCALACVLVFLFHPARDNVRPKDVYDVQIDDVPRVVRKVPGNRSYVYRDGQAVISVRETKRGIMAVLHEHCGASLCTASRRPATWSEMLMWYWLYRNDGSAQPRPQTYAAGAGFLIYARTI